MFDDKALSYHNLGLEYLGNSSVPCIVSILYISSLSSIFFRKNKIIFGMTRAAGLDLSRYITTTYVSYPSFSNMSFVMNTIVFGVAVR